MNGVESSTHTVGAVYPGYRVPQPPPAAPEGARLTKDNMLGNGYVSFSKGALSEALGASGFIDVTGGVRANFNMLVTARPDESVGMEDLKPGMMVELVAWVASKLEGSPQAAQNAQARINPKRAISLLGS